MPHVLHLLKAPVPGHALSVIESQSSRPGTTLTVVLMPGTSAPSLPAGIRVLRLNEALARPGSLAYSDLLDLIFSADQTISW